MNDNMMVQLDETDIDNVSGGLLALALAPAFCGWVAGYIYSERTK